MARAARRDTRGGGDTRGSGPGPGGPATPRRPVPGPQSGPFPPTSPRPPPPRGPPDPEASESPGTKVGGRPRAPAVGSTVVNLPRPEDGGVPGPGTFSTASPAGQAPPLDSSSRRGRPGRGNPQGRPCTSGPGPTGPSRPGHQANARRCCSSVPSIEPHPGVDTSRSHPLHPDDRPLGPGAQEKGRRARARTRGDAHTHTHATYALQTHRCSHRPTLAPIHSNTRMHAPAHRGRRPRKTW